MLGSEADLQRTLCPYVTGASLIGIKYKDGILLAADMGGISWNSLVIGGVKNGQTYLGTTIARIAEDHGVMISQPYSLKAL